MLGALVLLATNDSVAREASEKECKNNDFQHCLFYHFSGKNRI